MCCVWCDMHDTLCFRFIMFLKYYYCYLLVRFLSWFFYLQFVARTSNIEAHPFGPLIDYRCLYNHPLNVWLFQRVNVKSPKFDWKFVSKIDAIWQFWRLEVRYKGRRLSAEEMAFNLAAIIEDGQKTSSSCSSTADVGVQQHQTYPSVGLLTTANRRLWAQWRHQLLQGAVVNSVPASPLSLPLSPLFRFFVAFILFFFLSSFVTLYFVAVRTFCRLFTVWLVGRPYCGPSSSLSLFLSLCHRWSNILALDFDHQSNNRKEWAILWLALILFFFLIEWTLFGVYRFNQRPFAPVDRVVQYDRQHRSATACRSFQSYRRPRPAKKERRWRAGSQTRRYQPALANDPRRR